jgi:hypothetical protein
MMDAEKAYLQLGDDGLLHGTVTMKSLVLPWDIKDRIICAKSCFAFVGAPQELENGMGCISLEW